MAATGITAVRDALAALIDELWDTDDPADEVVTKSSPDIDTSALKGRKVYVLRASRADEVANRGEDANDYTLVILVVEKFRNQGEAPEEWIDERVAWVEWLLNAVANPRGTRLLADEDVPGSGLWPQEAELAVVLDAEEIGRGLFASQINVTYREQVEP